MDIHMDKSDHETRPMADAIFLGIPPTEHSRKSRNFCKFRIFVKILRCSIYRMSTKNFSFSIFEPQFVILEEKSRKNQLG